MKTIFSIVLLSLSLSALADSSKLVEKCRAVGNAKVLAEALELGLDIKESDIFQCGIDEHSVVAKYVWFCANKPEGGVIQHMVQKPIFKKCF